MAFVMNLWNNYDPDYVMCVSVFETCVVMPCVDAYLCYDMRCYAVCRCVSMLRHLRTVYLPPSYPWCHGGRGNVLFWARSLLHHRPPGARGQKRLSDSEWSEVSILSFLITIRFEFYFNKFFILLSVLWHCWLDAGCWYHVCKTKDDQTTRFSSSALTLYAELQEGHPAHKNPVVVPVKPGSTIQVNGPSWPVSIIRQHGPCWRARVSTSH